MDAEINKAVRLIKESSYTTVFTGAGISVESGIPPFRGKDGVWSKIDPMLFHIGYFMNNQEEVWPLIKELFFQKFSEHQPNPAHYAIAELEKKGLVESVITQNIDSFHQQTGCRQVIELHGSSQTVSCIECRKRFPLNSNVWKENVPRCRCGGNLRPDFVFFGESLPLEALNQAFQEAKKSDVMVVIGTTGEVMPAAQIPVEAKRYGAMIIEINTMPSSFTARITDVFLKGRAAHIVPELVDLT